MVTLGLEFFRFGEQLFLAFAGRGVALVALDPVAIALGHLLDLGSGGLGHFRLRDELGFELLGGDLIGCLADISRLIEPVGVRGLDVGVDDRLGRVRAA